MLICHPFQYKMHLIAWSTDKEDARMLLDMPSSINNVINDQVTLKLADVCFKKHATDVM